MSSERTVGRSKPLPSLALWFVMAWVFGILAGAAYGTRWLSVIFAIAAAICFGWFVVRLFGRYGHQLLGWLWRRAVNADRSN
jgi:hypothetical protein